eukprot:scaffold1361_cov165-Amphora_coffeaeformis.AAC.19
MYRLANASSHQTAHELGDFMSTNDPSAEPVANNAAAGIRKVPRDHAHSIDTESERRRLLQKLQTSSMKQFRMPMGVSTDDEDEQVDNKSIYSTKAVRVWWRRARQNIGKASRKSKKQFKQQLRNFSWKTKQAKYNSNINTAYNEMPQNTRLEAFLEMDAKSTASDPRGGKKKSRVFGLTKDDHGGNDEAKSVASRQSLPSVLRPVFTKKKQRERKVDRVESFTGKFSVEVQYANQKARPTLTRQGSSFIRRLLGSKSESVFPAGGAFSSPTSLRPFPVRLTPTTTDTTTSDNEEDEYPNAAEYLSEDEELEEECFEEEPADAVGYDSDEDEEISQLFRPIEADANFDPLPDRWSPSPSPSSEPGLAPRLPVRRPMPDEELDAPPKLVVSRPVIPPKKKPIPRKDNKIIYPVPNHIRAKPKKSWSGDSSIRSLLCGIVSSWSDGSSKSGSSSDEPRRRPPEAVPTKGILKRKSSIFPSTRRRKPSRSVSFDSIFVREYERVLGDNPACGNGPPISIGWQYESKVSMPVDEYEYRKPAGRTKRQLQLSAYRRRDLLLHEWGYGEAELRQARKVTRHIQNLRAQSVYEASRRTSMTRKPTIDDSDTSQPSLRRETAERATRYSPTPEMIPPRMQPKPSRS